MSDVNTLENERLADLYALHLLDTPPEERFDRVTRLAKQLFNVDAALINLIDRDRQWTKAATDGSAGGDVVRANSFCTRTVEKGSLLHVYDAQADEELKTNPHVEGDPYVRFYVGHPLEGPTGKKVGAFCLIDPKPRDFNAEEQALFDAMASWIQSEFALLDEAERAADIQRGLLPRHAPETPGFEIGASAKLTPKVGGDFYDWYAVPGGTAVTLIEVDASGMPAAAAMATLRLVLRCSTAANGLERALASASQSLTVECDDISAAAMHLSIDHESGRVDYVNAGCAQSFVVRESGAIEPLVAGHSLGDGNQSWSVHSLELAPGELLVLCSDGAMKANACDARVTALLTELQSQGASAIAVADAILAGAGIKDDATVVAIKRL